MKGGGRKGREGDREAYLDQINVVFGDTSAFQHFPTPRPTRQRTRKKKAEKKEPTHATMSATLFPASPHTGTRETRRARPGTHGIA